MRDNSAEILFQSFFAGGPCEQFWHGQGRPLFDVVHLAFSLLTMVLSTLQGPLLDGFDVIISFIIMTVKEKHFPSWPVMPFVIEELSLRL